MHRKAQFTRSKRVFEYILTRDQSKRSFVQGSHSEIFYIFCQRRGDVAHGLKHHWQMVALYRLRMRT